MRIFDKAPSLTLFPKDRIKSRISLRFTDAENNKAFNNFFITALKPIIIELEICNFVVLFLLLAIAIILGEIVKTKSGFPYKLLYIAIPIQTALTFLLLFLSFRYPKIRAHVGMIQMVEWIVFMTEYICYGKQEFILPPGGIIIYMCSVLYGTLMTDMWIKSSIAFVTGNVYFLIRILTKLQFNQTTTNIEVILVIVSLCAMASWTFYFFDLKFRRDFLEMMDKDQMKKFTSFFMEELPIGLVICSNNSIIFINAEFKRTFHIEDAASTEPIHSSLTTEVHNHVFTKLLNPDSKTSLLQDINDHKNFDYKIYKFGTQEFKIVYKTSEYSQSPCNVLCFFDVTEIKKLEKEKIEKRLQNTLMATMSHELRTPLNGIIGNIKSIKETAGNQYQNEISSINSCSSMLLMKVNDMLVNSSFRISHR